MTRTLLAIGIPLLLAFPARAAEVLAPASQRFAVEADEPVSFQRHVLPLMGRLGCNGRSCHGSFQGQGGFRLSLFGYDFKADHDALTDRKGPRVELKDPQSSLILEKPTLTIAHKGGKRMEKGSWQYRLFLHWVQAGAKMDPPGSAYLKRVEVSPSRYVFGRLGDTFQLRATALWSDGTAEDVTDLCRFRSNDDAIAKISDSGLVTAAGKGDTHVVAFYDNGVAPLSVMLPVSDRNGDNYPQVPTSTRIDELIVAKLRPCGIVPSEVCTDAEFLRRASLDITGTLPPPEEVRAFLADPSPSKRARKIDELLERPAYAMWWTTKLCDFTGNNGLYREARFGPEFSRQWYEWVYRRVKDNAPYDQLAAGMILANGRKPGESFEDYCREMGSYFQKEHPADFAARDDLPLFWSRQNFTSPQDKALGFSYAFLGIHLQCAQCHKHPFDQWTKQDFDNFSAVFRRVVYGTPPEDREAYAKMEKELTLDAKKGKLDAQAMGLVQEGKTIPWREVYVTHPGDDGNVKNVKKPSAKKAPPPPKPQKIRLLGGEELVLQPTDDPREVLMNWLRRRDNPYFARAFVNRVWAAYFGPGIIDPPDDMNLANPPSNGPLLDYLTQGFLDHHYDIKWLHREIANSRAYQLSGKPNETNRLDLRNFSHAVPRRLPAEVAYDALVAATAGGKSRAAWEADTKQRSIGLAGGVSLRGKVKGGQVLSVFGKSARTGNCDCDRSNEPSLMQTLFLLNDGEIQGLLTRAGGWVAQVNQQFGAATGDKPAAKGQGEAARVKVVADLKKKIKELEDAGKTDEAGRVRQVLAAARAGVPPTIKAPAKKPPEVGPLIEDAFLRTVSRPPTDREVARAREYLREADNPAAGLRDLLWALINTREFIVNH